MYEKITKNLATKLKIQDKYVVNVLNLLEEGNTIAFIARYRKELTNSLKLQNKSIGTLSGGEKQRVFLAQALVNKPNLLLLDEFTSNLDKTSEIECMTLVKEITKKENIITLCITHELSLIDEKYIDKILYLEKGCFKFISIEDYNIEKNNLKLCKHYVGDNNYA